MASPAFGKRPRKRGVNNPMAWPESLLIVDDQAKVRRSLIAQFAALGIAPALILEAKDAQEATALFDRHHPQLTLVDIVLFGNSGFDVLQHIRQADEDAAVIHARIRGVTPWPGAQTVFLLPGRDPLPALLQPGRVGETFTGGHPAPGTLVALRGGKLLIACRDALYEVSTLKPAGGKPMPAEAFWNGYCRAANKDGCGRAVSPSLG